MDKLAIEAFLYSADFGEDNYLLASSSSSSDSEHECCCSEESEKSTEGQKLKRPKVEGFAETAVPQFDDVEFKNNFHVSRATCEKVTELIYEDFHSKHRGGWERITPTKAAYVLLWYLAHQETFKQLSERFRITQSCVYHIVKVGCRNLAKKLDDFVTWPEPEQYEEESLSFYGMSKISGIVGALGVSHIKILKPKDEDKNYLNAKNYHSIAVQGNISYPSISWLVTPFQANGDLTPDHVRFNRHHEYAHNVVSNGFGLLKTRFQKLNHLENKDVPFIVHCVQAACVVYNICVDLGDFCEEYVPDDGIFEYVAEEEEEGESDDGRKTEVFTSFLEACGSDEEEDLKDWIE
ncbi:hypothetical protein NQ318_001891 [Aromia moschata]|uniref:DDE Tnp4 domain-containing protein n=1 Tax=Aromia moschata TaxID=1265417 RepID=A0AAV8Z1Z4_9CUCU|nr:hypothetical protein NQ318_001891 [Aromia moschata]